MGCLLSEWAFNTRCCRFGFSKRVSYLRPVFSHMGMNLPHHVSATLLTLDLPRENLEVSGLQEPCEAT